MAKIKINIEDINSFTSLSQNYLKSLSDLEFKKLLKRFTLTNKAEKKQKKEIKRYLKNKRSPYGVANRFPVSIIAGTKKENIILNSFAPERINKWVKPRERVKRTESINITNFSFLDNPQGTLNDLVKIAKHECYDINATINFNDKDILDIAPYIIWGLMNQSMFPYFKGGIMDKKIKAILKSIGVQDFHGNTDVTIPNHISPLILKQKNEFGDKQLFRKDFSCSTIEKTKNELTNKINEWLKNANLYLSEHGEARLSGIINEVLNNAERHGSDNSLSGNWAVAGFMQKKEDNYFCHLAFVNTGKTIATTINNADNPKIKNDLNNYILKHSSMMKQYDKNALATLYAVQDAVSSKTISNNVEIKGGFGLMDTIEFINILGFSTIEKITPAIAIISGDSCVLFKDKYHCCCSEKPRRQFFNQDNSIQIPPDDKYVFRLENNFPGTIITTRFALDEKAIEKYRKSR